jgi:hypothetical protein
MAVPVRRGRFLNLISVPLGGFRQGCHQRSLQALRRTALRDWIALDDVRPSAFNHICKTLPSDSAPCSDFRRVCTRDYERYLPIGDTRTSRESRLSSGIECKALPAYAAIGTLAAC